MAAEMGLRWTLMVVVWWWWWLGSGDDRKVEVGVDELRVKESMVMIVEVKWEVEEDVILFMGRERIYLS